MKKFALALCALVAVLGLHGCILGPSAPPAGMHDCRWYWNGGGQPLLDALNQMRAPPPLGQGPRWAAKIINDGHYQSLLDLKLALEVALDQPEGKLVARTREMDFPEVPGMAANADFMLLGILPAMAEQPCGLQGDHLAPSWHPPVPMERGWLVSAPPGATPAEQAAHAEALGIALQVLMGLKDALDM